jgi:hypothetical protein
MPFEWPCSMRQASRAPLSADRLAPPDDRSIDGPGARAHHRGVHRAATVTSGRHGASIALLAIMCAAAVAGCGGIGGFGGGSGTPVPGEELDACQAAVRGASEIPADRDTPADLDVAIALCDSVEALEVATLLFPDALDDSDPRVLVRDRCLAQPTLAGAPMCLALEAVPVVPEFTTGPGQPGFGEVVFGTRFDADRGIVKGERRTFKRSVNRIAWAAWLEAASPGGRAEITVWRRSGNRESLVWRQVVTLDGSIADHHGDSADLARRLDKRAGTYVMHYLVDGLPASTGTFTLK